MKIYLIFACFGFTVGLNGDCDVCRNLAAEQKALETLASHQERLKKLLALEEKLAKHDDEEQWSVIVKKRKSSESQVFLYTQILCNNECHQEYARDLTRDLFRYPSYKSPGDVTVPMHIDTAFLEGKFDEYMCDHYTAIVKCLHRCGSTIEDGDKTPIVRNAKDICDDRNDEFVSLKPCFAHASKAVIQLCKKCIKPDLKKKIERFLEKEGDKQSQFEFWDAMCMAQMCQFACQKPILDLVCDGTKASEFLRKFIIKDVEALTEAFDLKDNRIPESCRNILLNHVERKGKEILKNIDNTQTYFMPK